MSTENVAKSSGMTKKQMHFYILQMIIILVGISGPATILLGYNSDIPWPNIVQNLSTVAVFLGTAIGVLIIVSVIIVQFAAKKIMQVRDDHKTDEALTRHFRTLITRNGQEWYDDILNKVKNFKTKIRDIIRNHYRSRNKIAIGLMLVWMLSLAMVGHFWSLVGVALWFFSVYFVVENCKDISAEMEEMIQYMELAKEQKTELDNAKGTGPITVIKTKGEA